MQLVVLITGMEALKNLLQQEFGYDNHLLHQLDKVMNVIHLKKKDYLIRAGSVCSFIGFIETGVLRSFILKDGDEFNLDFYLTGSFVSSYTSFLTQLPAKTSIQALSNATVYSVSYEGFNNLLKSSAEWYKLGKYISDTLFIKKCRREKTLLINSAEERYNILLRTYPRIEQLVAQYHIASYLGIKPESLSRIKSLTYINK